MFKVALRVVLVVITVLLWIQGVAELPNWLAGVANDLSKHNGEWIVRCALIGSGLITALVALGPDRVRAWLDLEKSSGATQVLLPADDPRPAASADHERRLTRGHSVLSSDDPLHAALKREREHGRQWLSGLGIAAMASPLLPHTTQDDVAGWEANVRHLLRHEPGLLTMFNYVPPEGSLVGLAYIATVDAVTGG